MPSAKLQIIRTTWKRFREVLRTLVQSEQGPKAVVFAGTLLALMLAINGLNVLNSYVGRDFMSAIENRNMNVFKKQAFYYVGVFLASTVVVVFYRFTEERLGILWREQLTRRLLGSYMKDRTYYRLDSTTGVANPDQRITEDVRAFTTTTLSFTLLIINGTMTAISFSGVLWTISPILFCTAVAYAICGSVLTVILGKPLIRLNYNQLDMEANFRQLIRINRNLGFFTNGYNYFIQIIPAIIIAPLFIWGEKEFGVITQSTMAFATLLGAFSLVVTQFQSISAFTAVTARLHTLTEAIDRTNRVDPCQIRTEETGDHVVYQNVTLHSSDGSRLLLSDLSLEIPRGSRWLVTCAEDAPKVALFRATAGVWDCGGGEIIRPGLDDILFLPERPYLPPGTLREVLLRTGAEHTLQDAVILSVLVKLGLEDIVARANGLDADQDWDDLLSIGEQHMISVARLFLAKPSFVLLDSSLNRLDNSVSRGKGRSPPMAIGVKMQKIKPRHLSYSGNNPPKHQVLDLFSLPLLLVPPHSPQKPRHNSSHQ
ncbi:MAG: ABC transporter ATP-binding protein/permease [Verrucomicrobiaceae bacterium]|nr:MAG: ABC transporter ATP-binding protein/permease [Verrucomicrobiaceae bacterium]